MRKAKEGEFRSKVYADRPPYADFEAPAKFEAIKSIIARRLKEHPNAMCSYSGGSDSDIMLHLIEQVREMFQLPPVKYYFFETGLEHARMEFNYTNFTDLAMFLRVAVPESGKVTVEW